MMRIKFSFVPVVASRNTRGCQKLTQKCNVFEVGVLGVWRFGEIFISCVTKYAHKVSFVSGSYESLSEPVLAAFPDSTRRFSSRSTKA